MPSFTDQLDRTITLDHPPRRIISLVPSQTELLYTLGLGTTVVGITKFCIHPTSWFRTRTRVGGTKKIHPAIIHTLRPDLIIANKEENHQDQIEALFSHYPVWVSDVNTLQTALEMITAIGELTGKHDQASLLTSDITHRFAALNNPVSPLPADAPPLPPSPGKTRPRVAYFIWRNPWMVAGGDTFIHDMLTHAGFDNIFHDQGRYPSIDLPRLPGLGCDLVLLSSEPYPFRQQHIAEIRSALPHTAVRLVDGEMFSWYGSRLLGAPAYFQQLRDDLTQMFDL